MSMKGGDTMLKWRGGDIINTGLGFMLKELMILLEEITILRDEMESKNKKLEKIAKLLGEYEKGII